MKNRNSKIEKMKKVKKAIGRINWKSTVIYYKELTVIVHLREDNSRTGLVCWIALYDKNHCRMY